MGNGKLFSEILYEVCFEIRWVFRGAAFSPLTRRGQKGAQRMLQSLLSPSSARFFRDVYLGCINRLSVMWP